MRNLTIELKKCKHTGILEVLPILGLLGALYAFANFTVRKDVLLNLPLPPMDVFKAFPMINYKSECLMYSFTSENV